MVARPISVDPPGKRRLSKESARMSTDPAQGWTNTTAVSPRIRDVLEVLSAVKAASPASLEQVTAARRAATTAITASRGGSRSTTNTIFDAYVRRSGLKSSDEFDSLVFDWIS